MPDKLPSRDRYRGCILGLAAGDALGAPYEGGIAERAVWTLMGTTRSGELRWTDDTQMTVDLAQSILDRGRLNLDALARRFARSYRWSRGYGPGTVRVLSHIREGESWRTASRAAFAEGSFGNGAAMRAPVLALFFPRDAEALDKAARDSARVTHSHPVGMDGAAVMASAARGLLLDEGTADVLSAVRRRATTAELARRVELVCEWLQDGQPRRPRKVAERLGNGITVPSSCPTAVYIALRHRQQSFDDLMGFVISCGGDVDTIGAMAGALWGAANGCEALPDVELEARSRLQKLADRVYDFVSQREPV